MKLTIRINKENYKNKINSSITNDNNNSNESTEDKIGGENGAVR